MTSLAEHRLRKARRYATHLQAAGCRPDLVSFLNWEQVAEAFGDKHPPTQSTIDLISTFLAWNGSPSTQTPPLRTDSGSRSDLDWSIPS